MCSTSRNSVDLHLCRPKRTEYRPRGSRPRMSCFLLRCRYWHTQVAGVTASWVFETLCLLGVSPFKHQSLSPSTLCRVRVLPPAQYYPTRSPSWPQGGASGFIGEVCVGRVQISVCGADSGKHAFCARYEQYGHSAPPWIQMSVFTLQLSTINRNISRRSGTDSLNAPAANILQ